MDRETDLWEYLRLIWRRRFLVGAVTLAAILVAGVLNEVSAPVYEAKALILVSKPSFQAGGPPEPGAGLKIGALLASELPSETVVAFASSVFILSKVAERIWSVPMRDARFTRQFSAQPVRNTSLVELRARGRQPANAARMANEWAAVVAAESEALFATGAQQSFAFFDKRVDEARGALEQAEVAIRRFEASSTLNILQAREKALTEQIAMYETRLVDLGVSLGRTESELAQAGTQIKQEPKTLTLSKSITTDPFLHQAVTSGSRQDFVELSKLRLRTEELNPVYTNLDGTRATLAIRVAALKSEHARVAQAIMQLNDELARVRIQLAEQRFAHTQLSRAVENAKQVYSVLVQRREEAKLASEGRAGMVKFVASATEPDQPVAPRKGLNLGIAFVVGLIVGTLAAFGMESLGVSAARSIPGSGETTARRPEVTKGFPAR